KLRALKRSALSDVLLGEVRDRETGLAFMDLAGSGVNVYTIVHAPSAAFIPERLASDFIGVSRDFLAMPGTLKLLVWQALLPKLCNCALPLVESATGSRDTVQWLRQIGARLPGPTGALRMRNRQGCSECRKQGLSELYGYCGRSVAAEMIEPRLHPHLLGWVRRRGRGVHPDAQRSAMGCAMAAAYQGVF